MNEYIITEGKFDTKLIQRILPDNILGKVKIITGAGDTSALSLARSYYTSKECKILLLLDADTVDEKEIDEKRKLYENMILSLPGKSEIKILIVVPEIESLLFVDRSFIENYFNIKFTDFEFDLIQRDPKFGMIKLKGDPNYSVNQIAQDILDTLNAEVVEKIQGNEQIQEIVNYFN